MGCVRAITTYLHQFGNSARRCGKCTFFCRKTYSYSKIVLDLRKIFDMLTYHTRLISDFLAPSQRVFQCVFSCSLDFYFKPFKRSLGSPSNSVDCNCVAAFEFVDTFSGTKFYYLKAAVLIASNADALLARHTIFPPFTRKATVSGDFLQAGTRKYVGYQ